MCGTGAPASAAAACTAASSSMLANCPSAVGAVRRISGRRVVPVTASKAEVMRLAPPVSSAQVLHHDVVAEHRCENLREFVFHCLGWPNLNIRWATRRIWISSAPSVIR